MATTTILDHSIWFKQISEPRLREVLQQLAPDEPVYLEVDGVVGRWVRMRPYPDGTMTAGIRPEGEMKKIWNRWFKERKGEPIDIRQVRLADDYLAAESALFSEWSSPEDEEAFRDL